MAELNAIVELLRRHRQDLDDSLASTSTRRDEAADLLKRIESLRLRTEKTQVKYEDRESERSR